jgi:hypothetical protein
VPLELIKGAKLASKIRRIKQVETLAEVRIPHPMNPKEVFTFPPGTDPEFAKNYVRRMLLAKARQGEEKVDLPSELPPDREAVLKQKEEELERAKRTISDLEARKDLRNMKPGIYQDENTSRYYRVTEKGYIEELVVDEPPTE